MPSDFWKYLAGGGIGALFGGYAIYLIFSNPDTVKKWLSMILDLLSIVFKQCQFKATQYSIESRLNNFAERMSSDTDIEPTKVKLKWAGKNENEDCLLEDDQVVLVMRDRNDKNRNFVHAAYFFTSNMLLWRTKRHISQKQSQALDIYTTKKMIEDESSSSLRIFMERYFQPLLEDKEIKLLVGKFIEIDQSGFYTNILIKELTFLGHKTLMDSKNADVILEVKGLIEFLLNFANREVGDASVPDTFVGKFSRYSIKIVSTSMVRYLEKVEIPIKRINEAFKSGVENVYVVGPYNEGGRIFIDKVCNAVTENNKDLIIVTQKSFQGCIKLSGEKKPTTTYFYHLQNPKKISYIITDKMVQQLEAKKSHL